MDAANTLFAVSIACGTVGPSFPNNRTECYIRVFDPNCLLY